MIYWPALFLTLVLATLALVWRNAGLRALGLALLVSLAVANGSDWLMTGLNEVVFDAACDFAFGLASIAIYLTYGRLWQAQGTTYVAILACCGHLTYLSIAVPNIEQERLYVIAENWLFVTCCLIISGGSLWGHARRWIGHLRKRDSHAGAASRNDGP